MWEDRFEVYRDSNGDRKIIERIASDMSLEDALIFIKACIQEYWRETDAAYIIQHMKIEGEKDE